MAWEPLDITADAAARKEYVFKVQNAAIRARSIIRESGDWLAGEPEEAFAEIDPFLFGQPLNIVDVSARMLEGDREVTPSDVVNINYMVSQSPNTQSQINIRQIQQQGH